ncbi:MAG: CHAD domain-containing protein [Caulobacterales bacterium]
MSLPPPLRLATAPDVATPDLKARLAMLVTKAQAALRDQDAATAAHKARVSLKKARALARLTKAATPTWAGTFNRHARAAMAALSATRDADAMCQAARLCRAGASRKTRKALKRAIRSLENQRDAGAQAGQAQALLSLDRLHAHLQRMPALTEQDLQTGANAILARATKAAARARGASDVERRHDWRKREKTRQTAALELGESWPGKFRLAASAALSQTLGAERDLILLEEALGADPGVAGGPRAARRALRFIRRTRVVFAALADAQGKKVHRSET